MVRKLMLGLCLAAATFAVPGIALAKGEGPKTAPAQAAGNTVDATEQGSNLVFMPDTITVQQGQTVTFKNTGQADHTATADDGSWDSSNLAPGASFTTPALTAVGTVSYKCTYHAALGMVGTITVVAGAGGAKGSATATAAPSPSASPSFYGSGLPSPQAGPTPPPSQKYFPKVGGALLVLLVLGLGLGYVKLKGKLNDKG